MPLKKPEFLELHNQVKMYPWGSALWIPRLMGKDNPAALPWAELWMGVHPDAPSMVQYKNCETGLDKIIKKNPAYYLGKQAARTYRGLPFLFKLLAAEKPLSIQAHPNLPQAREGFNRENKARLALDDPRRNYKDPNHKPELICALTPFTGMCGFRAPDEIRRLLCDFLAPAESAAPPVFQSLCADMKPLLAFLDDQDTGAALRNFLRALLSLKPELRGELSNYIVREGGRCLSAPPQPGGLSPAQWEKMIYFAELYPGDPAVISPLYLNIFELEPGEAVFLHPGTPHSYVHGFGIELMANSDNVLRGGLTSKYVDIDELLKVLDCRPCKPEIIKPPPHAVNFTYPAPCGEFSLSVLSGGETELCENRPAICIVVSGELEIRGKNDTAVFGAGQSVFIPPAQHLIFRGNYTLYAAMTALP